MCFKVKSCPSCIKKRSESWRMKAREETAPKHQERRKLAAVSWRWSADFPVQQAERRLERLDKQQSDKQQGGRGASCRPTLASQLHGADQTAHHMLLLTKTNKCLQMLRLNPRQSRTGRVWTKYMQVWAALTQPICSPIGAGHGKSAKNQRIKPPILHLLQQADKTTCCSKWVFPLQKRPRHPSFGLSFLSAARST